MLKRLLTALFIALIAATATTAAIVPDEKDYDASIRKPVRRLHPERERAKAIKKLQEQRARKAEVKADPWDTTDEAWGTADVIPEHKDDAQSANSVTASKTTVQGQRIYASDKAELEALLNADYSLKQYDIPGAYRMTWRDDPITGTRDELTPYFVMTNDQCVPRSVTPGNTSNAVYFYFNMDGDYPGPLHLRVQYYADDPINYDELVFTIDGFDYVFFPQAPQRGKTAQQMYWENSDDVMHTADKDLVYALGHSHWAMIKLKGADGINHVKMLNEQQLLDLSRTLQLYRLLGGTWQ